MKQRKTATPGTSPHLPDAGRVPLFLFSPAFHLALICLAGMAIYANALGGPFVLDDISSITTNPITRDFRLVLDTRIVTYLSLALNYRLHGLEVTGYHLVNIAIHLANGILVYAFLTLLQRTPALTPPAPGQREQRLLPLFAALLFVCHPLQTQAVTYIAQRATSLATLFYLGTHALYLCARSSRTVGRAAPLGAAALVSAILALATKEIAFTLPLTLLLVEFTCFAGNLRQRLVPLAALCLPALLVPFALLLASHDSPGELLGRLTSLSTAISRQEYLLTQCRVFLTYLRLLVFPVGQNVDYDYPLSTTVTPAIIAALLLIALLAGLAARLLRRGRCHREWALALAGFGLLWFFVTMSIEASVTMPDVIFEHRLYLPSAGFFTSVVAGLLLLRRRLGRGAASLVLPLLSLAVVLLAGTTVARNQVWRDEVTFWEDIVAKSPRKPRAHGNLGNAYQNRGRLEEAAREYREVIRLTPGDPAAHLNLGTNLYRQRKWDEAIDSYRQALRLAPADAIAHYNLGQALLATGKLPEAAGELREAIRLRPGYDPAHNNLGIVLFKLGQHGAARAEFREAVRLNPGNIEAAQNLRSLEEAMGNREVTR
jgi:tetratricopeptide (TPR) repeat protein